MTYEEVKEKVETTIQKVAKDQHISIPTLKDHLKIVDDLNFKSLDVATFTALLEEVFGVDPFSDPSVVITNIRTIKDVCDTYAKALGVEISDQIESSHRSIKHSSRAEKRLKALGKSRK